MASAQGQAGTARKSSGLSWRTVKAIKGSSFTWVWCIGFAFFVIVPLIMAVRVVTYTEKKSGLGLGEGVETFVGAENLIRAVKDPIFWTGLGRVALYAVIIVPLTQILSIALALLIDAVPRKTANRFRVLLLLPYMTPGVVATLIWINMYSPSIGPLTKFFKLFGLNVDFFSGDMVWISIGQLALWSGIGYNMLIQYGSLQSIPYEEIEAARLDGASEFRIARSIKLPYMLSSVMFTTMFNIIGTFQLFNEPFLFRNISPETISKDFTPSMMIYYQSFQAGNLGYGTALSIVLAAVMCVLSIVIYIIQGKVSNND